MSGQAAMLSHRLRWYPRLCALFLTIYVHHKLLYAPPVLSHEYGSIQIDRYIHFMKQKRDKTHRTEPTIFKQHQPQITNRIDSYRYKQYSGAHDSPSINQTHSRLPIQNTHYLWPTQTHIIYDSPWTALISNWPVSHDTVQRHYQITQRIDNQFSMTFS